MDIELPQTELINARTRGLDELPTGELVHVLVDEQIHAVDAVRAAAPEIAKAVDIIAGRLRLGGRLHYVGAGTSGRIAYVDASECPPTFGVSPELVCAHIAGGPSALTRAVEGAEDNGDAGAYDMREHVDERDAVIGISASGSAAYVIAALVTARACGAWTLGIANSEGSKIAQVCDQTIVLRTGPEAIAGSTRLKAGTSAKIALNAISTAVMVRLGKVYDNLMVDVMATNRKLRARAVRLVVTLAEVNEEQAEALLARAGGSVKLATVMSRRDLDRDAATALLAANGGSLRASL